MPQAQPQTTFSNHQQKIRYAVVGLGWFAQAAALPAFEHTQQAELTALVSDDPTKLAELAQRSRGVQRTFSYVEYDDLLSSGLIDAVYIALPNHLHCDYAVRAAQAGIHVLCEKPMAVTVEDCEAMIKAAQSNHVKLMIAYRLHLEPANLQAIEIVRSGQIGEPRIFNSLFTQQTEAGNIRVDKDKGGGTLADIGIYCINASRYLFQDEPIEVFAVSASKAEPRFSEVAEMTSAILRFPGDRLATFTCSFGAASVSTYHIVGTKGDLQVDPAYPWQGELKHYLTVNGKTQEQTFAPHDQLAAELDYFAECIKQDREPEPSGIEGLNDVRIIRALEHSIETGSFVQLNTPEHHPRPSVAQTIERPPIEQQQDLVHAAEPSSKP